MVDLTKILRDADIEEEEAQNIIKSSPNTIDNRQAELFVEHHDSPFLSAGAGALSSLSFGTSNYLMTKFGLVDRDTLAAIREYNPKSYLFGEITTDVATILASGGSSLLAKGGSKLIGKKIGKETLETGLKSSKYFPTAMVDNFASKKADDIFRWADERLLKGQYKGSQKALKLGTEVSIDSGFMGVRDAITDTALSDREETLGSFTERAFTYASENAVTGFIFGTGLGAGGRLVKNLGGKIGNSMKKTDIPETEVWDELFPDQSKKFNAGPEEIARNQQQKQNKIQMTKDVIQKELQKAGGDASIVDDLFSGSEPKILKAFDDIAEKHFDLLEKSVDEVFDADVDDLIGLSVSDEVNYIKNNVIAPYKRRFAKEIFTKENNFVNNAEKALERELSKGKTTTKVIKQTELENVFTRMSDEQLADARSNLTNRKGYEADAEAVQNEISRRSSEGVGKGQQRIIDKINTTDLDDPQGIRTLLQNKREWAKKAKYNHSSPTAALDVEFARDMERAYDAMIIESLGKSDIGQPLVTGYKELNGAISTALSAKDSIVLGALEKKLPVEKYLSSFLNAGGRGIAWRFGLGYVAGPFVSAAVEGIAGPIAEAFRKQRFRKSIIESLDDTQKAAEKLKDSAISAFFKENKGDIDKVIDSMKSRTIKSTLAGWGSGDRAENYQDFRDKLNENIASMDIVNNTAEMADAIGTVFPELGDAMAAKATEIAVFLHKRLIPEVQYGDILGNNKPTLSDLELDKFDKYMTALDPRRVYASVAKNLVSKEEIEVLRVLYPSLQKDLIDGILGHIADKKTKLNYNQKLTLSELLGLPFETTMSPDRVQQFQQTWAPPEQAGQHGGARPNQNYNLSADKQSLTKTQQLER